MEIQTTEHKRASVMTVEGRIDSATATDFENAVKDLIDKGVANLILDFSEVDFLSSAGLRVMVTARKALRGAGGDLVLANPSERVVETLDIAGLDVLFEVFPDRESAVGSF